MPFKHRDTAAALRSSSSTIIIALVMVLLLAACGASGAAEPSAPTPSSAAADGAGERPAETAADTETDDEGSEKLVPIIAASELEVGQNRLPIGILKDGNPINDPDLTLHLRLYYLDGEDRNQVQSEADAVYRGEGLPWGLYVAHPQMDRAGAWGLEISIPQDEGDPQVQRIRVEVVEEPQSPPLGSPAIASENLTIEDVPDLEQLTSDFEPDPDFYQMTIAEALEEEKPLVVMFATPGYCMTAVCAPNMGVMKELKAQFAGQINVIHVEVYPYPFDEAFAEIRFVEAMQEWNLTTEPWTFLIDREGIIRAKYEGGITFEEMQPALQHLVDGTPIVADTGAITTTAAPDDTDDTNDSSEREEPPTAPAPTPADGEVVNQAGGFAVQVPQGWEVLINSSTAGNGVVMLGPPGMRMANPEQMVLINAGPLRDVARGADPDASLEEVLDAALVGGEMVTLSEREAVEIGGLEGYAATLHATREDVGEVRGRIVIARLDGERLFQVSGFAPEDTWDAARFEMLVETVRFFAPGGSE